MLGIYKPPMFFLYSNTQTFTTELSFFLLTWHFVSNPNKTTLTSPSKIVHNYLIYETKNLQQGPSMHMRNRYGISIL